MHEWLIGLIEGFKSLGYVGIALALTFEFVPAELVLPLAGFWVYEGDFNIILVILAGTIGGVTGPLTLYALGRYGGRPLVLRFGKYFLVREKEIVKAEQFFAKYGSGVAFFGRFLPGVRTAVSIPCGMANMNVWKFSIYTFAAMLPITSLYVYLGYKLGPRWEEVGPLASQYLTPVAIVILVVLVAWIGWKWLSARRKRATSQSNDYDSE